MRAGAACLDLAHAAYRLQPMLEALGEQLGGARAHLEGGAGRVARGV